MPITATEAVRSFSEILNAARYKMISIRFLDAENL